MEDSGVWRGKKNTLMKRKTDEKGRADVLFTKVREIKSKQKGNIRRDSLRSEAPALIVK